MQIIKHLSLIVSITASVLASPLDYQSFVNGSAQWLVSPSSILVFLSESRTVSPFTLDPVRGADSVCDVVYSEGVLAVSAKSGIYLVDMSTRSAEKILFPDTVVRTGKVALDMDYLWVGSGDTLWRFDRLGREWLGYPLPKGTGKVLGITSNVEEITCISTGGTNRFSTAAEKWTQQSAGAFSAGGIYRFVKSPHVIDKSKIFTWNPGSSAWEMVDAHEAVKDFVSDDTAFYFIGANHVFTFMRKTQLLRPLNTPNLSGLSAMAKSGDTLIVASKGKLTKIHAVNEAMDFVNLPEYIDNIEKVFVQGRYICVLTSLVVGIYDNQTRLWIRVPRPASAHSRQFASWDDEGLQVHYTPDYRSGVKGTVQSLSSIKYMGYEEDSVTGMILDNQRVFKLVKPNVVANVTMHNSAPDGRYADMFFDNSNILLAPKKGVYYRGAGNDVLSTFRVGTTSNEQIATPTLPETRFEGSTMVLEGREKLATRDRKVFKTAFGAGRITSRSVWKMLPYSSSGTYTLVDTTRIRMPGITADSAQAGIIPGSLNIWIDGEKIDSAQYTFVSSTGKLRFNDPGLIDPVAQIKVQYDIEAVDTSDITQVHFIPEHDFGSMRYGEVMVSPRDWVSVNTGFIGMSGGELDPLVHTSIPFEVRRETQNLLFKLTPELTYNAKLGTSAKGASMQSRFRQFGLVLNGMMADTGFMGVDTLRGSFGRTQDNFDGTFSYDITQRMPVSVFAAQSRAFDGNEKRFGFSGGLRYPDKPFFDMLLSRTELNPFGSYIGDTLFHRKDKARLRVYEVSSPILSKLLHCSTIGYDVSHTEYRAEYLIDGILPGRITYGRVNVSPVNAVTVSGIGLYRRNPEKRGASTEVEPILMVQTIDAPKGVDIQGQYSADMKQFETEGVSNDTISRSLGVILKPGLWLGALKWFTPMAGINQSVYCLFPQSKASFSTMLAGLENKTGSSLVKRAGIYVYPAEWLLYRNENRWTTADTLSRFYTFNDIKWWFGTSLWQTRWEYTNDNPGQQHTGYSLYERLWTTWFQTRTGINGSLRKSGTSDTLTAGPRIDAGFNLAQFSVIKLVTSNHSIAVDWLRVNGVMEKIPNVSYYFDIDATILPNISLAHRETFVFTKGDFGNYIASLSLMAVF